MLYRAVLCVPFVPCAVRACVCVVVVVVVVCVGGAVVAAVVPCTMTSAWTSISYGTSPMIELICLTTAWFLNLRTSMPGMPGGSDEGEGDSNGAIKA